MRRLAVVYEATFKFVGNCQVGNSQVRASIDRPAPESTKNAARRVRLRIKEISKVVANLKQLGIVKMVIPTVISDFSKHT